jgi:hypothetical protein
MNGLRGVHVEGAKYGVSFGSALAIAISYTANHMRPIGGGVAGEFERRRNSRPERMRGS